jgi:hypothetical protein
MDLSKEFNVLLFGVNGWIGNKVYKLLNAKNIKNINVYIAESRADDYDGVENEIKKRDVNLLKHEIKQLAYEMIGIQT